MSKISDAVLAHAAKTLLAAPLRGAQRTARFVEKGCRLAIITDERTRRIGDALHLAAQEAEADATLLVLDRPQEKPLKVLPPQIRAALARVEALVFAAAAPNGERSMREQLVAVVKACGLRHARLPDITEAAFALGLVHDQRKVVEAGKRLAERAHTARVLEVESPSGTSLRIGVTPGAWVERLGEIVPGTTVGFPAGALFTSPESVDGTFVADASLGEFFGAREGLLSATPVRFTIEGGRVVSVHVPDQPGLEADIRATLAFADNSNRIGLIALGVNVGIEAPTGEASVDQTMPGLHLGVGDPGGKSTAVAWKARTSFVACQAGSRVVMDGNAIIDRGTLVEMG